MLHYKQFTFIYYFLKHANFRSKDAIELILFTTKLTSKKVIGFTQIVEKSYVFSTIFFVLEDFLSDLPEN